MSMYGRDPWGGPLEVCNDSATDDDRSRNMDLDRAALSRTLDETQQSWLLAGPGDQGRKKKRYVDLGCLVVSRKLFVWTVGVLVAATVLAGLVAGIAKAIPRHHRPPPPPDDFTVALRKALMFFNAQRSGKLPKHNPDQRAVWAKWAGRLRKGKRAEGPAERRHTCISLRFLFRLHPSAAKY